MSEPAHGPSYAQLQRERDILETYVSDLLARERELVEALRIGLARCTMQEHADADVLDNTSANARWIRQARAVLAKAR